MFISPELQDAINKVEKKKGCVLEKNLVCSVVGKMRENLKRYSRPITREQYFEARRFSLNQACIWDEETRPFYRSLIGTFFGKHGGLQKSRCKKNKQPLSRKKSGCVLGTFVDKKTNQICLDI